jgi:hypothetical protein
MQKYIRQIQLVVLGTLTVLLTITSASSAVFATSSFQSKSNNYGVNEVFFGAGGDLDDCSSHYCAQSAVGETTIGNTKSSHYKAQGGFNTHRDPTLEFSVNGGTTNLGYLSTTNATMTTATFSVETYLASGYIVQAYGSPPIDDAPGNHVMNALTTPTASSLDTEQFGMNLAANTSPLTVGAAPVQVPTNDGFGAATANYDQPNKYLYNSGDTIASSSSSSGITDYTISYLFNIGPLTPDGQYTLTQTLVATSTF